MSETAKDLVSGIEWTHDAMLSITEDLTDAQFVQRPGPAAPPIGWHLFHIARWADRFQASLPNIVPEHEQNHELPRQHWLVDSLAQEWGLEPDRLGWLQTGPGMSVDDAVAVAEVGMGPLLDYARGTFGATHDALAVLNDQDIYQPRYSIHPHFKKLDTGQIATEAPKNTIVLSDFFFHMMHSGRHLGMIEALRGALFSMAGTASV